jgi:hypothetical protein
MFVLKDAIEKGHNEIVPQLIESEINCSLQHNLEFICNEELFKYLLDNYGDGYFNHVFDNLIENPVAKFILKHYPEQTYEWAKTL